jgi:hypothetical protein
MESMDYGKVITDLKGVTGILVQIFQRNVVEKILDSSLKLFHTRLRA